MEERRQLTQCDKILDYIKTNGSITQLDAIGFGCTRLAARIADLKKDGYKIGSKTDQVITKDGSKTRVSRYFFE